MQQLSPFLLFSLRVILCATSDFSQSQAQETSKSFHPYNLIHLRRYYKNHNAVIPTTGVEKLGHGKYLFKINININKKFESGKYSVHKKCIETKCNSLKRHFDAYNNRPKIIFFASSFFGFSQHIIVTRNISHTMDYGERMSSRRFRIERTFYFCTCLSKCHLSIFVSLVCAQSTTLAARTCTTAWKNART